MEAVRGAASAGAADAEAVGALLGEAKPAIRALYATIYGRVLPAFAQDTFDELAASLSEEDDDDRQWRDGIDDWLTAALDFIEAEGAALVSAVAQETVAQIAEVIREGIDEGQSIEEIARRLDEEIGALNRVRARRIARTEVIRASNLGALEGARAASDAAGLDLLKEWIATPDSRTRRTHREAGGQTVALAGSFEVGGFPAIYPGDPKLPARETVNCRCTHAFVLIDQEEQDD